ncbi:phosphoinositide 3-kinase regulatory subunit 6 isoform X2 [Echeneis naucrates]|uniref:Phosphoinositide 3-kinase regulatory subunit 6-like n=1 Tax=Echeneis naucrates TaxID=173247 RepID=A0A665UPI0_ECHNA|nr:phosphoinositide 3-kinase regulatory subunit 6-like isoform X2 [Echeneis naucrates]
MDSPKDNVTLPDLESSLHLQVKALLKGLDSQGVSQRGLLRWTLEKRVKADPSCSAALITVLVRMLEEKLQRPDQLIPASLYGRVYDCLMKLLILPLPHSAVALNTLRSVKMEITTPGSLYLRRVVAEKNLNSRHFTAQERVFVLADPDVFSTLMEGTVRAHLEMCNSFGDTATMEKNVMAHVLQAGLGVACQSSRLNQALEALGDHTVKKYFEEVVLAVERGIKDGIGGCVAYINRLQHIHRDILAVAKEEKRQKDCACLCATAMSYPEIKFLLWKDVKDLWNLLENFTLSSSSNSNLDEEDIDKRHSVRSEGCRKERDPDGAPSVFMQQEVRRNHTARVVVMGDDRVLGRLSRAYHSFRDRESKHLLLTKKLNLQLYYIPVRGLEPSLISPDGGRLSLALSLGRLDPWYDININTLRAAISKLARQPSNPSRPQEKNFFLLDTLCYYLRCGTQPVNLPIYSVKMTRSRCDESSLVEDMFVSHLEADIPEFRHLKERFPKEPSEHRRKATKNIIGTVITVTYTKTSLSRREAVKGEAPMTCGVAITSVLGEDYLVARFDSVNPENNTKIQSRNISIKTMEHRTLSVCLDKDPRRTYTDIQRIDISPCLDPAYKICSRFSVSEEQEVQLSKYLNRALSLPINTFTGVAV